MPIINHNYTFGYICDQWSRDHPLLTSPKGLAYDVSTSYPHAYSYPKGERENFKVGDINIHRSPKVGIPTIIELYAQRYGGSPKWGFGETKSKRLEWFKKCLKKIDKYLRNNVIRHFALPYMIACDNKSKGNWIDYEKIINEFACKGLLGKDPYSVYLITN